MRPNPQWTLGTFENKLSPALSPRLLLVENIPVVRCNLRSLVSWFQLFGALVYVEHAGSDGGSAILEYADSLGGWRAMTCEFPAWGDMTVSAVYTSLMNVKGYGKGREKGRTTIPITGIQTGVSAGDSRMGNRGVKRGKDEFEIEDREVDAHLGVPVPLLQAPMAQPSLPGIMTRRWLTKIIDGQEYIIVDGDEDDPDIVEIPPIKVAAESTSKAKQSRRRRPRNAGSRPGNIRRGPMEVDLRLPLHDMDIESSDRDDEANVEQELQDDEVDDDEIDDGEIDDGEVKDEWVLSSEDEDSGSSHSEALTVEIPEPEQSAMVGRM